MATEAWSGITVTSVAATGDLKQLYPTFCTPGVAKAGSTPGQLLRRPMQGALHSIQVKPDGANGGTIELWDVDGGDAGADVSSLDVITNAQLVALVAQGRAKLIYRQDFAGTIGSGPTNAAGIYRTFVKGLAARMYDDTPVGNCELNLVVTGGFMKTESRGGY